MVKKGVYEARHTLFRIIAKQMYEYGATNYKQALTGLQKYLVAVDS